MSRAHGHRVPAGQGGQPFPGPGLRGTGNAEAGPTCAGRRSPPPRRCRTCGRAWPRPSRGRGPAAASAASPAGNLRGAAGPDGNPQPEPTAISHIPGPLPNPQPYPTSRARSRRRLPGPATLPGRGLPLPPRAAACPQLTEHQHHLPAQAVVDVQRLLPIVVLLAVAGVGAHDGTRHHLGHGGGGGSEPPGPAPPAWPRPPGRPRGAPGSAEL